MVTFLSPNCDFLQKISNWVCECLALRNVYGRNLRRECQNGAELGGAKRRDFSYISCYENGRFQKFGTRGCPFALQLAIGVKCFGF